MATIAAGVDKIHDEETFVRRGDPRLIVSLRLIANDSFSSGRAAGTASRIDGQSRIGDD